MSNRFLKKTETQTDSVPNTKNKTDVAAVTAKVKNPKGEDIMEVKNGLITDIKSDKPEETSDENTKLNWQVKNLLSECVIEKVGVDSKIERKILGGAEYSDEFFEAIRRCINSDPRCVLDAMRVQQPFGGVQLMILGPTHKERYGSVEAQVEGDKIKHFIKIHNEKLRRIFESNEFTKEYFI